MSHRCTFRIVAGAGRAANRRQGRRPRSALREAADRGEIPNPGERSKPYNSDKPVSWRLLLDGAALSWAGAATHRLADPKPRREVSCPTTPADSHAETGSFGAPEPLPC